MDMDLIQTIVNRWSDGKIKEDDPNIDIARILAQRKGQVEIDKINFDLKRDFGDQEVESWTVANKYTDFSGLSEIFGFKATIKHDSGRKHIWTLNDIEVKFNEVHAESERIQDERLKMICCKM
jgi:hypothetical protein